MKTYTISCKPVNHNVQEELRKMSDYMLPMGNYVVFGFDRKWKAEKAEKVVLESGSQIYKKGKPWSPPEKKGT